VSELKRYFAPYCLTRWTDMQAGGTVKLPLYREQFYPGCIGAILVFESEKAVHAAFPNACVQTMIVQYNDSAGG